MNCVWCSTLIPHTAHGQEWCYFWKQSRKQWNVILTAYGQKLKHLVALFDALTSPIGARMVRVPIWWTSIRNSFFRRLFIAAEKWSFPFKTLLSLHLYQWRRYITLMSYTMYGISTHKYVVASQCLWVKKYSISMPLFHILFYIICMQLYLYFLISELP